MESAIKKNLKIGLYGVMLLVGFVLVAFGFQHKAGKSAAVGDSFFASHVFADAPGGDDAADSAGSDASDDMTADSNDDSGSDDDDDDGDDDG